MDYSNNYVLVRTISLILLALCHMHGVGPSCLSDPMATTTLHACLAHPPQVLMDLSRNARLLARDSLNGPEVMDSSADRCLDGPSATCSVNLHFTRTSLNENVIDTVIKIIN